MTACASYKPATNPKNPVIDLPQISVNGQPIDEQDFSEELQYHPADDINQAIQKAGQALVIRELLLQQLSDEQKKDSEEQAFAELLNQNSDYKKASTEDSIRYYQNNKAKFMSAPLMEISHILLAAASDDIEARIKQKQLADELIKKLQQDLDLFESFVIEYSDCPSNKTYGSLGQISKGQTVPEFERQVFSLNEGLHDKPIESRYGYHITLINKKLEGNQLEFSMVEDKINDYLNHRRYRQSVSDYLYGLLEQAEVDGIELKLEQENIFIG